MINFEILVSAFSVMVLAFTFAVTTIIPVITSLLILLSNNQPIKKAFSFLLGFYIGLLILFLLVYFLLHILTINFDFIKYTLSNSFLNLIFGFILILISIKFFRSHKTSTIQTNLYRLFNSIDEISLKKHTFLSAVLIVTAPKNWLLVYIALSFLLKISFGIVIDISILGIYLVVSSMFLIIPILLRIIFGKKVEKQLDVVRNWLMHNSNKIIGAFLMSAGMFVVVSAISGYTLWG